MINQTKTQHRNGHLFFWEASAVIYVANIMNALDKSKVLQISYDGPSVNMATIWKSFKRK